MTLIYISINLMEFLSIYITIKSFLHSSYKPKLIDIFFMISATLIPLLLSSYNSIFETFSGTVIYLIYCMALVNWNYINGFILNISFYCSLYLFQLIAIVLLTLAHADSNSKYIGILGNGMTIILLILSIKFLNLSKLYDIIKSSKQLFKLVIINTYIICIMLVALVKINSSYLVGNIPLTSLLFVLISITNGCVIYYDQAIQLKDIKITTYEKELPIYNELINNLRANRHEYNNRLQAIYNLSITCNDFDSLKNKLAEYSTTVNDYSIPSELLKTNMPYLAASLISLNNKANELNINLKTNIINTELSSRIPEYQITDFVSILVNNAIEASKKEDTVYLNIDSSEGVLFFEIRNRINEYLSPEKINHFFDAKYTTKNVSNETHGYGLYYLKKELKKTHSRITSSCLSIDDKYWIIFKLEL